jgi:phage recombination protein Bet
MSNTQLQTTTAAEQVPAPTAQPKGGASILARFAHKYGVKEGDFFNCVKNTCFKPQGGKPATNEQLMALCIVADEYDMNPWLKQIYAFPDKDGGIVPVIGVDGWAHIINRNPAFDGIKFTYPPEAEWVTLQEAQPSPAWIECEIYRKDRSEPVTVREYLDEAYRPPMKSKYTDGYVIGPWQTHTKRMLRHKAMIQAARIAFGFTGIYDPDEAERIIEAQGEWTQPASGQQTVKRGQSPLAAVEVPAEAETPPETPQDAPEATDGQSAEAPEAAEDGLTDAEREELDSLPFD